MLKKLVTPITVIAFAVYILGLVVINSWATRLTAPEPFTAKLANIVEIFDGFSSPALDPAWSFVDPVGNSSLSLTAVPDHVTISVPAGSLHDCWAGGAPTCVRLMRSIPNTDATYEIKIDGDNISQQYQEYGLFVSQNQTNFVRFGYWSNISGPQAVAWKVINNSGSNAIPGVPVILGPSNYIRVTKSGNTFTLFFSQNGLNWTTVGSFNQPGFTVNQVGLEVTNAGSNPLTTGKFDYFYAYSSRATILPSPTPSPTPTPSPSPSPSTPPPSPSPSPLPSPSPSILPSPSPTPSPGGGLPLDPNGWTIFTPSSDSLLIYVSSSTGNNANSCSGSSPATPKATLAAGYACLRTGFPDWLLLKRGDVWNDQGFLWAKSGRGLSEPMLVSSYGDPALPRPKLNLLTVEGFSSVALGGSAVQHVAVAGLHFKLCGNLCTVNYNIGAFDWNRPGTNIIFEDNLVEGAKGTSVVFVGGSQANPSSTFVTNVKIRRNVIVDAYRGSGVYAYGVDGLLIEENIIDQNGWQPGTPFIGTDAIYHHDLYIGEYQVWNATIRRNILTRAASHGLQLRNGGVIENNLFVRNPINFFLGAHPSTVRDNVALDGTNMVAWPANPVLGEGLRGWGFHLANILSALVEHNILAHKAANINPAFAVSVENGNSVNLRENIIYNWPGADVEVNGIYTNFNINQNYLQDFVTSTAYAFYIDKISHSLNSLIAGQISITNNQYFSTHNPALQFELGLGNSLSFSSWVSQTGDTSQWVQTSFADPNGATIEAYDASIGGPGTFAHFISQARNQSKTNWNTIYTAEAANNFIGSKFAPVTNGW